MKNQEWCTWNGLHLLAVLGDILWGVAGAHRSAELNDGYPKFAWFRQDREAIAQGELGCSVGGLEHLCIGFFDPGRPRCRFGWFERVQRCNLKCQAHYFL